MSARWLVWLVVLAASPIGGCGGKVNLGEKRAEQPTGDPCGEPCSERPGGPEPTVGELVAQLPDDTHFEHLAVAGDFLYLGNYKGVSRCQKANCVPSLEPLSTVRDGVASLRADGSFLGIGYSGFYPPAKAWLATYSQPAGANEHVVFDELPSGDGVYALLWYGGFVYWPLNTDQRVYRCALPDCEDGPEMVGSFTEPQYFAPGSLQADGELVFYSDRSFIYRYEIGGGRAVALHADESLSEALPTSQMDDGSLESAFVESIATASGKLYASVGHATSASSCDETCPHEIVRWPVRGGVRQTLVSSQELLGPVFAFGDELVWIAANRRRGYESSAVLHSCLADDCAETTRTLGLVVGSTTVAADTHLYWFEGTPNLGSVPGDGTAVWLGNYEIRRAARLSPQLKP
jgi:hypothetical protein